MQSATLQIRQLLTSIGLKGNIQVGPSHLVVHLDTASSYRSLFAENDRLANPELTVFYGRGHREYGITRPITLGILTGTWSTSGGTRCAP